MALWADFYQEFYEKGLLQERKVSPYPTNDSVSHERAG